MIKIMLVDDSSLSLTLVNDLIKADVHLDTEISAFSDALVAQQQFESLDPDFVITDISMPQLDGYEFIDFVKSHKNIPVLAMSGSGIDNSLPDTLLYCAKKVGADYSILKTELGTKLPKLVTDILLSEGKRLNA